jgi:dipeptidyl-peptidase 4
MARPSPAAPALYLLLVANACHSSPPAADHADSAARANAQDAPSIAGKAQLSLDDLYDPKKRVNFNGRPETNQTWVDATHWVQSRLNPDTKKTEWSVVDASTGQSAPFLDMSHVRTAIAAIPGVSADQAERLSQPDLERMSKDRRAIYAVVAGDVWVARLDADKAVRITSTPDVEEQEIVFSPDGTRIAFLAKHDLHLGDAQNGGSTAITHDGSEKVLNGKLDWLYQEEVFGRGNFRAFWWSPDSQTIAFLRLDLSSVPEFTIADDTMFTQGVEREAYPRPGEPNPTVKLELAPVAGGEPRSVDLSAYAAREPLVVDVSWSPDSRLVYEVQDREQTMLDLRIADADGSKDTLLVHETTQAWVERTESPTWLKDGSYLWFSERNGYKHLYHYKGSELVAPVTSGEWEARTLHGVDEAHGLVYFSGTERSAIGSDVYVICLDGTKLRRLSEVAGTHSANFSPDFGHYIDVWSDLWTPARVALHKSDGTLVRTIDENKVEALSKFTYSKPELSTVKARDGFAMEAMLVKPADFDPAKRYPVMMFIYAGPHNQTVKNAWPGTAGMFQQLLAQRGVAVWSCDNRTASGKGAISTWPCYQRMGESELADIEDSIAYLKSLPWVDADRIGITGWSYGGFMTSYALTHSSAFALGIAGGSVTDWRLYDSIYTERYMRLPKQNEDGYNRTSVVKNADKLHGKLVLVHGAIDDNVHPQNTIQLVYALQKANANFDFMLYPRSRHGVTDPLLVKHWRTLMLRSIDECLLGHAGK